MNLQKTLHFGDNGRFGFLSVHLLVRDKRQRIRHREFERHLNKEMSLEELAQTQTWAEDEVHRERRRILEKTWASVQENDEALAKVINGEIANENRKAT